MHSALLRFRLGFCSAPRSLSLLNNDSSNRPKALPVRAGRRLVCVVVLTAD